MFALCNVGFNFVGGISGRFAFRLLRRPGMSLMRVAVICYIVCYTVAFLLRIYCVGSALSCVLWYWTLVMGLW